MPLFTNIPLPWSLELGDIGLGGPNALSANSAYFMGVSLPVSATVTAMRVNFTAGGNGNYDIGMYDVNGNRLFNRGATASATGVQTYTLGTPFALSPGRYWLAFWISNATDTVSSRGNSANMEVVQSVSASSNLPTTNSGAANTTIKPYVQALLQGAWS